MRKGLKKAYEITDAKISFVSLVDKAANKRQFLLKKADDGKASFTTYGRIIKADAESHYVTGIVYEPMEEDSHGPRRKSPKRRTGLRRMATRWTCSTVLMFWTEQPSWKTGLRKQILKSTARQSEREHGL